MRVVYVCSEIACVTCVEEVMCLFMGTCVGECGIGGCGVMWV